MDKVFYGTDNYSDEEVQDYVVHALKTHGNVILSNNSFGSVNNIQATIRDLTSTSRV